MTLKTDITIHPNDEMFHGSLEHYLKCGNQIADMVELSGAVLDKQSAILELPCGLGRGTRQIAVRFQAQLNLANIQSEAVDFLARSFMCTGYVVSEPVKEFRNIPNAQFDVAIMGSLITHPNLKNTKKVVTNFAKK